MWLEFRRVLFRSIKKHFDEKGFKNAEVTIIERDLADNKEQVDVDVMIDRCV